MLSYYLYLFDEQSVALQCSDNFPIKFARPNAMPRFISTDHQNDEAL